MLLFLLTSNELHLHVLCKGLLPGKTAWSTSPPAWSGLRRLDKETNEGGTMHRSLFFTQPSCCSNQGVTCGNVSGIASYPNVVSIDLSGMRLSGSLPAAIGNFGSLTRFVMGKNIVRGTIPSTVGLLTSLRYLDIGSNVLTGTIPSSIGLMTKLTVLLAGKNRLTGSIPLSIGSLRAMITLYLENNSIAGSIPATVGVMTDLVILSLYANSLSGTIPENINSLKRLEYMYIDNNAITGTIPTGFSALTNLIQLNMNFNYLTMGSMTTVPASTFAPLTLRELGVAQNCLVYTSILYPATSANATNCKCKEQHQILVHKTESSSYVYQDD